MVNEYAVSLDIELKDRSPLRRYMDLTKYIDLLKTQTLYFRRADRFIDKFEGALTSSIRRAIDSARAENPQAESADTFYRRCRMGTFVSCWTHNTKDNMALWQLYGGASTSLGVNTTVERLTKTCLSWSESVLIQKVKYIDHFENPDMVIGRYTDPLQFKHEAYDFEQEVRILVPRQSGWEKNPESIHLPVSVSALVTSIVVAPEAGGWFFDIVQDVTERYGLKVPVKMSALAQLPT